MSGISLDHSFPRHFSGDGGFNTYSNLGNTEHFSVIDLDSDSFEQVIIIDVPSPKRRRVPGNSKAKNWSRMNLIDVDDDECADDNHSSAADNVGTTSREEPYKNYAGPAEASVTPIRLYKCKRTYSDSAAVGNVHGLDPEFGSKPSDYDHCELVEDSSGKVKEIWGKGFSGTTNVFNVHSIRSIGSPVIDGDDYRCFCNYEETLENFPEPGVPIVSDMSAEKSPNFPNLASKGYKNSNAEPGDLDEYVEAFENLNETEPFGLGQEPGKSEFSLFHSTGMAVKMHDVSNVSDNEPQEIVASFSNSVESKGENGQLQNEPKDTLVLKEDCVFQEREQIKETDEYKLAMEKEWASRQEALRVQAEEARHLRILAKRKKAESMRLLDMERRQKERVEEIRISQKKEEEILNMREAIRAEVHKELSKLEIQCKHKMSLLLHALGIPVGGWPNPSPQQVQTSYKKALLAFHPDRASRLEIRQQVEAEEKFKLINRLKDKIS